MAVQVAVGGTEAAALVAERAFAGAALDPPQLLHVDVNELARSSSLIPHSLLEPEPAKLAHPDPGQDPRDGRERHPKRLSDLGGREPQPPQLHDRVDAVSWGAIGHPPRRRRAIA
jgi:hypothetical protein